MKLSTGIVISGCFSIVIIIGIPVRDGNVWILMRISISFLVATWVHVFEFQLSNYDLKMIRLSSHFNVTAWSSVPCFSPGWPSDWESSFQCLCSFLIKKYSLWGLALILLFAKILRHDSPHGRWLLCHRVGPILKILKFWLVQTYFIKVELHMFYLQNQ